jgi:hypothetical protein
VSNLALGRCGGHAFRDMIVLDFEHLFNKRFWIAYRVTAKQSHTPLSRLISKSFGEEYHEIRIYFCHVHGFICVFHHCYAICISQVVIDMTISKS